VGFAPPIDRDPPPTFTTALKEQLGLVLTPGSGPIDVWTVRHYSDGTTQSLTESATWNSSATGIAT
jgi:hypothetical protein